MKIRFDVWGENSFNVGLEVLCIRQLVNQAEQAAGTAAQTAAGLGTTAAGEGAQLNPFYAREMKAEHAFDPSQLNEMLTAAGLGAGAEAGGLETSMQRQAATTGNASAGTKDLDELALQRMKAGA